MYAPGLCQAFDIHARVHAAAICRSGITVGGQVGKHLHLHPATVVPALFPKVPKPAHIPVNEQPAEQSERLCVALASPGILQTAVTVFVCKGWSRCAPYNQGTK